MVQIFLLKLLSLQLLFTSIKIARHKLTKVLTETTKFSVHDNKFDKIILKKFDEKYLASLCSVDFEV